MTTLADCTYNQEENTYIVPPLVFPDKVTYIFSLHQDNKTKKWFMDFYEQEEPETVYPVIGYNEDDETDSLEPLEDPLLVPFLFFSTPEEALNAIFSWKVMDEKS